MGPCHRHRVHVVSHKAIRIFCEKYPHARTAMDCWYRVAKRATWSSFAYVKQSCNTADHVAPHVVFDIGGNKYRLIAEMNFTRRVLFIRRIMTRKEYTKGAWKSYALRWPWTRKNTPASRIVLSSKRS